MRNYVLSVLSLVLTTCLVLVSCNPKSSSTVRIAVEFNNHAACAYVAKDKGWFETAGFEVLTLFQLYESGAAIAAALARGDIQVGYLGLTAAIASYAQGVPITIVSGVNKYGYGLVARPEIDGLDELSGKTIGCLREGTVTDFLFQQMIERYQLEGIKTLRMSPSDMVLAMIAGRLDAAFIPEHHATMAQSQGFKLLLMAQDLWPGMQGDVLVVRNELIRESPELVAELIAITQKATDWINAHPQETSVILARQLSIAEVDFSPYIVATGLKVTPDLLARSMERLVYSTELDLAIIQQTIDYMASLGYIKMGIKAEDMLDLSHLKALRGTS